MLLERARCESGLWPLDAAPSPTARPSWEAWPSPYFKGAWVGVEKCLAKPCSSERANLPSENSLAVSLET